MKKKFIHLLTITFCLLLSNNLFSQNDLTILGKVLNKENLPVSGATILEKGKTNSVVADALGAFSIKVSNANSTLVISSIGYATQEVKLKGGGSISVELVSKSDIMSEVVVVGYGSVKKSDITGAISSVKASDLKDLPTQRVDQALQGRAAGVTVLNTDGAPGGNTLIRVRGLGSITGGNSALIVIDGQLGGDITLLNPNDIQSLEVLKDASATAIYGSRGANGVVLITTKTGKKGKPALVYSYNYGSQKLRHKLDLMNAGDYAKTINASTLLNNFPGTPTPNFTNAEVESFVKNGGTDWQNQLYQTAAMQNHSLSVSGGSDNVSYFFSGGYLNQDGIVKNSSYNRFNLRGNMTADVNKFIKVGANLVMVRSLGSAPPFGETGSAITDVNAQAILQAPLWSPTTPVYDINGNYSKAPSGYGNPSSWNPLASTLETTTKNLSISNSANVYIDFSILPGLNLKVIGAADIATFDNRRFFNEKTFDGRIINGAPGTGYLGDGWYQQLQNTNILTYDKSFKKHHLTFTGVAEQQTEESKSSNTYAQGFSVIENALDDIGSANRTVTSSERSVRVLNSYLGRLNYIYDNKYLFTASYRADGSSVFGTNNKWGYFPSFALAWKLSEEKFIKNLDLFSDLKLRGSWGQVGNQAISPYQTLAALVSGQNYPYNGGAGVDLGFKIDRAANPNLKWETTTQTDIGLDFGLFGNRLIGTVDIYKKETKDLLLYRELPGYTGLSAIIDNVGSTENKGLEISISGDPLVGKVKWNTGFNIAFNKNKVISLGDNKQLQFASANGGFGISRSGLMYLFPGQPFGQIFGYETQGLWKESEKAKAFAYGQLPGEQHYTDLNNDGIIDVLDKKVIGNALPKYAFGWNNRVSYNKFDLSFLIQGVKGNDIFNMQKIRLENPGEGTSTRLLNSWTVNNQNTDIPAFTDALTRHNANLVNKINLDPQNKSATGRYIEDGSYLRLKNITLSYNVNTEVLKKAGISRVRAYASATNLLTFTKYKGYDPEVSSYNSNDASIGIDFGNYPTAKTFTLGIDISF